MAERWKQLTLCERIQILGMPCTGKTIIGQGMASLNGEVTYIPEPYELIRRTRERREEPRKLSSLSVNVANWLGFAVKNLNGETFGRVFIEERGPVDNYIFSTALLWNKEISKTIFEERALGWDKDLPQWLVFFMIEPRLSHERAMRSEKEGEHTQLPFLRKLYGAYKTFIEYAEKSQLTSIKVFDMSGKLETNFRDFERWYETRH